MARTWFITGTSSGFGRELTEQLLRRGDTVAATLRSPSRLDDLAAEYGDRLLVRQLDVTDAAAVRRVVDTAFAELGRIDVVISNAGIGIFGAAEEMSDEQIEQIEQQINTNVVGAVQLARAVTPHFREQGGRTHSADLEYGRAGGLSRSVDLPPEQVGDRRVLRGVRGGGRAVRHPHHPGGAGHGGDEFLRRRAAPADEAPGRL